MKDTRNQYTHSTWRLAQREMTIELRQCASRRQMVCYSDLLARIKAIRFDLDDIAYHAMRGDISRHENQAGRGMLSCIVVHKVGDQEPGTGYYELAGQLGRATKDRLKCWVDEVKLVFDVWANRGINVNVKP